jgi:hypothetical protein
MSEDCNCVLREGVCREGWTYVLDESALVLERVTLAQVVEVVVKVFVNLSGGAVLDQKTAEDAETAHPDDLAVGRLSVSAPRPTELALWTSIPGHTSVGRTLSLTEPTVTSKTASGVQVTGTGARVHGDGLADNEAIRDELTDGLAGVGIGDLAGLVGVEPDLSLSAANNGSRQALLGAKVDPVTDACQCLLCWVMVYLPPGGSVGGGREAIVVFARAWIGHGAGRRGLFSQNRAVDTLSGRRFDDTDILTGMEGSVG